VLDRQVLDQRLELLQRAEQEVQAWQKLRNQEQVKISWRFTMQDARIKLLCLYSPLRH
jgi:hypothetical protein